MKMQDLHPIDSAIIGLNDIYHIVGDNGHFINSPSIVANNKIVRTGSTYLLSISPCTPDINLVAVQLKDVYFDAGYIHLLLINILNGKTFEVNTIVRPTQDCCEWKLIDLNYLSKIINKHQNRGNKDYSLLEFEF